MCCLLWRFPFPLIQFSHFFVSFFSSSFANANVLLVLGEMMGQDKETGGQSRSAIPLVAGAIVTAQATMTAATYAGDKLTVRGIGRKPLFLAALLSLPIRCALIIWLENAGHAALLATQIFDGLGGGLFGLVHPYLVADITFGTGRFNVLSESLHSFACVALSWSFSCSQSLSLSLIFQWA